MSRRRWRLISVGAALLFPPGCAPGGQDAPKSGVIAPAPKPASAPAKTPAVRPRSERAAEKGPPGPVTPDLLVAQAAQLAQRDNLDGASRLLEQALKAQPKHRTALHLLAEVCYSQASEADPPGRMALYIKAGELMRRLRDSYPDLNAREHEALAGTLYNMARAYALGGRPDEALDRLAEAVAAGFDQPETMAADKDLSSIRNRPRFAALVRQLEQKSRDRALAAARRVLAETVPFPFDFALRSIANKTVRRDDLKGDLLLVVLWGTWSPPSRKLLSPLEQLLAKYRDQGLTIVGINYERERESESDSSAAETVRRFVKEHAVPFPCLLGDEAARNQVPDFAGYPTILFLDRARKVRARVAGYRSFVELEAILTLLLGRDTGPSAP